MFSNQPVVLVEDFLPIIFSMDFSQYGLSFTVTAYENEKETSSTFTSRGIEISKIADQSDWLVLVRLKRNFVVFSIKLEMEENK
jgi:hypothetical protein